MATHGTIGEFQNAQESWQSYVERLQQYFVANDVRTAEKQRAVLLSALGGQTYQLIRNLLTPTKPTEVTFAEIVDAVARPTQTFHYRCKVQLPLSSMTPGRRCIDLHGGTPEAFRTL